MFDSWPRYVLFSFNSCELLFDPRAGFFEKTINLPVERKHGGTHNNLPFGSDLESERRTTRADDIAGDFWHDLDTLEHGWIWTNYTLFLLPHQISH